MMEEEARIKRSINPRVEGIISIFTTLRKSISRMIVLKRSNGRNNMVGRHHLLKLLMTLM